MIDFVTTKVIEGFLEEVSSHLRLENELELGEMGWPWGEWEEQSGSQEWLCVIAQK